MASHGSQITLARDDHMILFFQMLGPGAFTKFKPPAVQRSAQRGDMKPLTRGALGKQPLDVLERNMTALPVGLANIRTYRFLVIALVDRQNSLSHGFNLKLKQGMRRNARSAF